MMAFAGHGSMLDTRPCPQVFLQKQMHVAFQAGGRQGQGGLLPPQLCVGPTHGAAAVTRWQGHKNCPSVDDETSFGIVLTFRQQLAENGTLASGLCWPGGKWNWCDLLVAAWLFQGSTKYDNKIPVHYSGWIFEDSGLPGCSWAQASLSRSQFFP